MAEIDGTSGNDNLNSGDEDDRVRAYGGNDRINTGNGADHIAAGTGNDTVYSGAGNDTVGLNGNDPQTGLGAGDDVLFAGDGDDSIYPGSSNTAGGEGDDTIYGGNGRDYINDGYNATGEDRLYGGAGDDTIYSRLGDDYVDGGDGNDSINDYDTGDDTLLGGRGSDTISGVDGNDWIDGGIGDDLMYGGDGDDTFYPPNDQTGGGAGDDTVYGGEGNDYYNDGWNGGADVAFGGVGDDTLMSRDGDDTLSGDEGDDSLVGGNGDDSMSGGDGEDYFQLDGGNDDAMGGDDNDIFYISGEDARTVTIDGGTTPDAQNNAGDFDQLLYDENVWEIVPGSLNSTLDEDGNSRSGSLQLRHQEEGNVVNVNFTEIENIVCFARGTMIDTEEGLRPVEALQIGDMVETKDNGLQPIRWIGSRGFGAEDFADNEKLYPVRIAAGALGEGYPVQDLIVSPQHRVLVKSRIAMRMFGEEEVLVAAKKLVLIDGIDYVTDIDEVEYFHFIFDQHEIVFSNGAETESLYTGPESIKALSDEQREELLAVFPELLEMDYEVLETPVRTIVDGRFARKLAVRHAHNNADVFND